MNSDMVKLKRGVFMKKKVLLVSLFSSLILFAGCSKTKTLTCTRTEKSTGIEMKEEEKVTFDGSKVKKYEATIDVAISDTYKSYKSIFMSSIKNQYKAYDNMKGVTFESKETDDGVKIVMKADVAKVSDSDLRKLSIERKADYKKTKDARKKEGFTCK